jgi:hypothetical protein
VGAMTVLLAKTFSPFHLKGDHFVTLNVIDDLRFDNCFDLFSHGQFVVSMRQEYFGELDFIAGVAGDPWDIQGLVLLNLELLTGYFHNC